MQKIAVYIAFVLICTGWQVRLRYEVLAEIISRSSRLDKAFAVIVHYL